MANTATISRTHLVYGVCLPLAVLLGYLLSEPFELSSIAVVGLVFAILSTPLLIRWHHPLLIFSCNAFIYPYFLPGHPMLWMIAAALSFSILALNRSLGQKVPFFQARSVARSLIFLTIVVAVTAYVSGGIGLNIFGSRVVGSKRYFIIFLAVLAYFGFSCVHIKRKWAELAVYTYFLSSLTALVGYFVALAGPAFYFLVELFPVQVAVSEISSSSGLDLVNSQIIRYGGFSPIAMGLACLLFARYGARGLLDFTRPWRLLFLMVTLVMAMYSGFRSTVISILLILAILFYIEGLCRTRLFPILLLVGVFSCAAILPFASKLPLEAQRSLAFLPLNNLDPMARQSAEASSDWRIQMWKEVLPTVPKYLIKGKGLALSQEDLDMLAQGESLGSGANYEGALIAGDYHSGPLSILIPFGLFGVAGFVWFLWASVKVLRQNRLYGDPSLHRLNTFLLAFFVARILIYIFIFGAFASDLLVFASLIGLSVSINGGVAQPPNPGAEPATE